MKKPTLRDVARIAEVSVSTVSTALSHPEKLRQETLERIMKVISDLGYIRNGAAQALVSRKTQTVAVVVPTIDNPFYSKIVASIQKVLVSRGYHLLVGSHEFDFLRGYDVIRSMVEKGIDGIVIMGAQHEVRTYEMLRDAHVPYVLGVSLDETGEHHSVGFSNREAIGEMADLVANMGHTRVALCGGGHDFNERAREREAGAVDALSKHGIDVPEAWRLRLDISIEGGREAFRRLWADELRPSAIICTTDVQAIGALDEARKYKVNVPSELSITGFDDIEYASMSNPPLTTVSVPITEIGIRSTYHLLDLIARKSTIKSEKLTTNVVLRGSLGMNH